MSGHDTAGWEIDGQFYPLTFVFKWGDPALVHEVTGLTWDDFEDPILNAQINQENGDEDAGLSALTLSGLLAVAVKRVHPTWGRGKVRKFVENLDVDAADFIQPEEAEDDSPPAETAGPNPTASAETSSSESESDSKQSTPEPSGTPTSPTSPEEPSA